MLTSYDLMLELFVDCNSIREYCTRLQAEAETMQEVSMNAAIAAGHTGSHIRTFTEIARQIGSSSHRLAGKIQKMRADTNVIVNETLDAMIRATQLASFEKSLPRITSLSNARLVKSRVSDFEARISQAIEKIYRDVQSITSELKAVEEIQKRVWAVITRLRIEAATMEPEERIFVASIADSLSESVERAGNAFGRLFETVRHFESKLTAREGGRHVS